MFSLSRLFIFLGRKFIIYGLSTSIAQGMSVIGSPFMNLVRLKGLPILRQLHIEEQLLRTSSDNWCIVNDGTNDPAIVMGVSG